jgi:hypothetical protein
MRSWLSADMPAWAEEPEARAAGEAGGRAASITSPAAAGPADWRRLHRRKEGKCRKGTVFFYYRQPCFLHMSQACLLPVTHRSCAFNPHPQHLPQVHQRPVLHLWSRIFHPSCQHKTKRLAALCSVATCEETFSCKCSLCCVCTKCLCYVQAEESRGVNPTLPTLLPPPHTPDLLGV